MNHQFPAVQVFQFTKSPLGHAVKTRLAGALSDDERIDLHCAMTEAICRQLHRAATAPLTLWIEGDMNHPLFARLAADGVNLRAQQGRDLGERLFAAFEQGLATAESVVVIGSDCPWIDSDYVRRAIQVLKSGYGAVIGPAADGGYVLLGLRSVERCLFDGIVWGASNVFSETIARIEELGWSYQSLTTLCDIDRPEDLSRLADPRLDESLRRFAR